MVTNKHSKIGVHKNASFELVHSYVAGIVKIADLYNILKDEIITVKGKCYFEKNLGTKKKAWLSNHLATYKLCYGEVCVRKT